MNFWKDIPTFNGDENPFSEGEINCVIEISKDTNAKYEYDGNLGAFRLERCLISAMRYPCNYGFIPRTLGDDGDPLDAIVYSGVPLNMGTVVSGKIIGALDMEDKGKKDYKVLVVPSFNSRKINEFKDLEENYLDIIKDFFSHYKNITGSKVLIRDWLDKDQTKKIIFKGCQEYDFGRR